MNHNSLAHTSLVDTQNAFSRLLPPPNVDIGRQESHGYDMEYIIASLKENSDGFETCKMHDVRQSNEDRHQ
jgi:hypothetical protein